MTELVPDESLIIESQVGNNGARGITIATVENAGARPVQIDLAFRYFETGSTLVRNLTVTSDRMEDSRDRLGKITCFDSTFQPQNRHDSQWHGPVDQQTTGDICR